MNVKEIVKRTSSIFELVKDVDDVTSMLSMMGVVIDKWAEEHGMSVDEVNELYEDFSKIAKLKHDAVGLT